MYLWCRLQVTPYISHFYVILVCMDYFFKQQILLICFLRQHIIKNPASAGLPRDAGSVFQNMLL